MVWCHALMNGRGRIAQQPAVHHDELHRNLDDGDCYLVSDGRTACIGSLSRSVKRYSSPAICSNLGTAMRSDLGGPGKPIRIICFADLPQAQGYGDVTIIAGTRRDARSRVVQCIGRPRTFVGRCCSSPFFSAVQT